MIKVVIKKENKKISNIQIIGHANYDDYGKDIVCASVSTVIITTVNAIGRIDEKSITYEQNDDVFIQILKHTEVIDKLLENLLSLLESMKKQYPKNIKLIIK